MIGIIDNMRLLHLATVCCFCFLTFFGMGQITITNTQTATQLVNDVLLGTGISATNITLNGTTANATTVNNQIAYFEKDNTNFPIARGVVMSTGNANTLPGPANQFSSTNTPFGSDPDLVTISGVSINDAVVLEFDFVAVGDSMEFRYQFGSEEYPEFVGGTVNDAFGFFLSGPGISGPYTNNAVNLAIIPNTTTAVSINTVNQNQNTAYYVSNGANFYGTTTKLDGYTTVLVAAQGLICGETYHIKLAIGDGGDSVYDSAVFLEAESFKSNAVKIEAESNLQTNFTDTVMAEGCVNTNLVFIRPAYLADSAQTFYITFGGTADPNADFTNLQDSVNFAPGQDTVTFLVSPVDDGIAEPDEFLDIFGYSITVCGDTIYDSLRLYVVDNYLLTFDLPDSVTAVCLADEPEVEVTNLAGSIPPFTYDWSFTSTNNPVNLPNNGVNPDTITHYLEVTDGCGDVFEDSVVLVVDSLTPTLSFNPGNLLISQCIDDSIQVTASVQDSTLGPYNFFWATGATTEDIFLQNNGVTDDTIPYPISLTDGCGTLITDTVTLVTDFGVSSFFLQPADTLYAECPSTILEARLVYASGNWGPWTHQWTNGTINDTVYLSNDGVPGNEQWHYVTTTNACGMIELDSVLVINDFILPEMEIVDTVLLDCVPDSALSTAAITNGAVLPYSYVWSNGSTTDSAYFHDEGTNNTEYTFTVTGTDGCGFTVTETGVVITNQTLKVDTVISFPSAACNPTGVVSGIISGFTPANGNGLIYEWKGPGPDNLDSVSASVWQNLPSGWYYFTASDTVCTVTDSVFVDVQDPPIAAATANPNGGEAPLTVGFTNQSQNTDNYLWVFNNGDTVFVNDESNQSTIYTEPGTYTVMLVANQGTDCPDTTYLTIEVIEPTPIPPIVEPTYDQPNVFSPNGDGTNEVFTLNIEDAEDVYLVIVNRWGNKMFEGTGTNPSWDGYTQSGKLANDGVYYYKFIITGQSGQTYTGDGFFHLVSK